MAEVTRSRSSRPAASPAAVAVRGVLGLAAALTLAAAACGPAPSLLSDPRDILAGAAGQLRAATSVHLDATLSGNVALGSVSPGSSPGAGNLVLTGSHATADIDVRGDRADLHFDVPALLGLTGELRQVGADLYLQSTLTSSGWHHLDPGTVTLGAASPSGWLAALAGWLDHPAAVPARLDDASCPAGRCYVVRLRVAATDIRGALGSPVPSLPATLAGASVTIELRVDQRTLDPSGATVVIDLGPGGALTIDVTFTSWNAPLTIEAPGPSELVPGPLFR